MKRLITFLFFIVQFSILIAHDFHLSIEPLLGIKYGQLNEYVFLENCFYNDNKLSELNWEIKPEYYVGMKIDGSWKFLFSEIGIKFGLPKKSGAIKDSDWKNIKAPKNDNYLYKTNYSEHDNYLKFDFSFNIKSGISLDTFENKFLIIKTNPFLAFDYEEIRFEGRDGELWYGTNISTNTYYEWNNSQHQNYSKTSGKILSYERFYYIFWVGFDELFDLKNGLKTNIGVQFAPYILAESFDTHWKKNPMNTNPEVKYADRTPEYFSAVKCNFGVSYELNRKNSIGINANYFYTKILRGKSYEKKSTDKRYIEKSSIKGGASEKTFDISVSWKYNFF